MTRRRRRYQAPPPAPTIEAPALAPLVDELLGLRAQQAADPSPLGAYALRRCAAELAGSARPDAHVVVQPEGWSGWGAAICPTGRNL